MTLLTAAASVAILHATPTLYDPLGARLFPPTNWWNLDITSAPVDPESSQIATRWNAAASRWEADSGAVFDLRTNVRRPDGWTSADAAGLAILPGLVRYDEAFGLDRDRPRLPGDDARDERLRLAGVAPRRVDRGGAADGRAPPARGVEGPLRLHA